MHFGNEDGRGIMKFIGGLLFRVFLIGLGLGSLLVAIAFILILTFS